MFRGHLLLLDYPPKVATDLCREDDPATTVTLSFSVAIEETSHKTYKDNHPRFGRAADDEKKGNDQTNDNAYLDIPDNRKYQCQEHHC